MCSGLSLLGLSLGGKSQIRFSYTLHISAQGCQRLHLAFFDLLPAMFGSEQRHVAMFYLGSW